MCVCARVSRLQQIKKLILCFSSSFPLVSHRSSSISHGKCEGLIHPCNLSLPSLHTLFSMECSQNYLFSVRKLCFKQMEINFMESKSNSQSLTCAITLKCSLSAAVTSFESPENWVFATETAFILELVPERRRRVKFSRVDLCKAEQTT